MLPILALLILGALGADEADFGPNEQGVFELTERNFDAFVDAHPVSFIDFFAPWCRHCKTVAPEIDRLAGLMSGIQPFVPIAKVDLTAEKGLGARFGIKQYPFLVLWKRSSTLENENYDEFDRTAEGMRSWIRSKTDPSYDGEAFDLMEWAASFIPEADCCVWIKLALSLGAAILMFKGLRWCQESADAESPVPSEGDDDSSFEKVEPEEEESEDGNESDRDTH